MAGIIGWIGVASYVSAYAFLSLGWMKPDRIVYHLLNAIGGICLVIISYDLSDTPNLFVNIIWIVIAVASIIRIVAVRGVKK